MSNVNLACSPDSAQNYVAARRTKRKDGKLGLLSVRWEDGISRRAASAQVSRARSTAFRARDEMR